MNHPQSSQSSARTGTSHVKNLLPAVTVFAAILAVYLVTLGLLFPHLPVITRLAEEQPGYADVYPPFRVDEYNYYVITENLLSGDLYAEDSPERGWSIGFPVLAAPLTALAGPAGLYLTNVMLVWCSLVVFYLLLRRYATRAKSLVLTGIFAFASLNWFYAVSAYTEPLAELLVVLSAYFLLGGEKGRWRLLFPALAGAALGLVLFSRPHYILLAVPFFLFLAWRKRKPALHQGALAFTAGCAAVVGLWMIRNALVFGGPFTFEYSRHLGDYLPGVASGYMHGNIFLGIHRLLFDQYKGLFTITPVFLLFPAGMHVMWRKGLKRESLLVASSAVIMILFAAASTYPFTEFGLGSRHLVPVMPLMMVPLVFFLDGRWFSRAMLGLCVLYTFYHAGIGWFTGGEPGKGFFLGILNENQSRAVILARKDLLPHRTFDNRTELVEAYMDALDSANLYDLLQVLHPDVVDKIEGHERDFMLFLRRQPDPREAILSADPGEGIVIRSFSIQGNSVR